VIHDIVTDHIGSPCDALPDGFVCSCPSSDDSTKVTINIDRRKKKKGSPSTSVRPVLFFLFELNLNTPNAGKHLPFLRTTGREVSSSSATPRVDRDQTVKEVESSS
jgi:hypothetical protein